jgi:hypothetical protein
MQLLVVRQGRDQLAAVQMNFCGGEARLNYLIIHRPAQWVGNGLGGKLRPGRWWAGSIKHPDDRSGLNDFDLRNRGQPPAEQLPGREDWAGVDEVADIERFLTEYPTDMIECLFRSKHSHPIP